MRKKILGLDLGSNSIGWALLSAEDNKPDGIIDVGARIFTKAVEEKTPTPKNVARRDARLARRVIQRRSRRKERMLSYLVSLGLLPPGLKDDTQPEITLNALGDPYALRKKALDEPLEAFEFGRVILHLVQRRGFLSNRKTLLGDMIDDPDVKAVLNELESNDDSSSDLAKEETAFKKDISDLRSKINDAGCRTLGEYLASLDKHDLKRNRSREGGHLRTDRQMYRDELDLIWKEQSQHSNILSDDVKEQIENIIFYQRPLKLNADRVGKCSLERSRKRIHIAKLEYQRFRYLQDINNLQVFNPYTEERTRLSDDDREKLITLFESKASITFAQIKKHLGFDKGFEFNLETANKKLKGNVTACEIRAVYPGWGDLNDSDQHKLVEDILTIKKKSVLKKRLVTHWDIDKPTAVNLCMLEFEPDHGSLSLKAINKLLPFLLKGQIYSDARVSAGYGYEILEADVTDLLGKPPVIANPIVNKALHELRRLVNAIIKVHGRPDIIRVEMARDLEMNTKRYKAFEKQQKDNTSANEKARDEFSKVASANPSLGLSKYPSRVDKLKYRLWNDQQQKCAYSGKSISLAELFSPDIEIDHIIPYSMSLDDSYMNKVVCLASENRYKGQRTPSDAYKGNEDKWDQITQSLNRWAKQKLKAKKDRFYMTDADVIKRDFLSSQLNDTRYISKVALDYLSQLGCDVTTTKGVITAWMRKSWELNGLIGITNQKERIDHRHHTIDAVVTACIDRSLYQTLANTAKSIESSSNKGLKVDDIHVDAPWLSLKVDLAQSLQEMIVSIAAQRKLSGALHEETGAGFIEGVGNVSRKNLDSDFKANQVKGIIDDTVRECVEAHLKKFNGKAKDAFAEGVTVYHKNQKTPIKRVRVVKSKTTLAKLEKNKFGVRNRNGDVFKWLTYGNLHHVEVLREKDSGKVVGEFVTMMEANHRAKGIGMEKQDIVKTEHEKSIEFLTALHINDTVSLDVNGVNQYYYIRKLGSLNEGKQPRPTLNLVFDAISGMSEISDSIVNLFTKYKLKKHEVNVLGKIIE